MESHTTNSGTQPTSDSEIVQLKMNPTRQARSSSIKSYANFLPAKAPSPRKPALRRTAKRKITIHPISAPLLQCINNDLVTPISYRIPRIAAPASAQPVTSKKPSPTAAQPASSIQAVPEAAKPMPSTSRATTDRTKFFPPVRSPLPECRSSNNYRQVDEDARPAAIKSNAGIGREAVIVVVVVHAATSDRTMATATKSHAISSVHLATTRRRQELPQSQPVRARKPEATSHRAPLQRTAASMHRMELQFWSHPPASRIATSSRTRLAPKAERNHQSSGSTRTSSACTARRSTSMKWISRRGA